MDAIAKEYGLGGGQDLLAGIGYGKYSARQVLDKLSPEISEQTPAAEEAPKAGNTLAR